MACPELGAVDSGVMKLVSERKQTKNCTEIEIFDVKSLRLISDKDRFIIVIVISCFICIPVCLVGIVANVINIVVFIRQRFNESINISLLCLSFADLGSLITLLWRNLLYIPHIGYSALPLDAISFIYLTGGTPHITLVRISGCITAFIALERCVCIAFPLKVKSIFTHTRTIIINVSIYIIMIAAILPIYYSNRITWKFYPKRNRTLLGLVFTENYNEIEKASFILNGLFIPFSAFFVDVVCTIVMVVKLHKQDKWRREAASTDQSTTDGMSKKDFRIVQLVVTLTIIFIVCSLPINANYVMMLIDKDVSVQGKYANFVLVTASFAFLCEAINSSLNHFVYVHMSSKFRRTYMACFSCVVGEQKQTNG